MAILVGSGKRLTTDDGIPYMWQSGDVVTKSTYVGIITASDGGTNDEFGTSVSVGSGRIVAGAPFKDVNGNSNQGAAYIFDLNGTQVGIITSSDGWQTTGDLFGRSVAVGCGKIVVGSYLESLQQGSSYIYDLDGLNEIKKGPSSGDSFRASKVAVGSGKILNNSPRTSNFKGRVYIYDTDGSGEIVLEDGSPITLNDNDYFGNSLAVENGRIVISAGGSNNKVYIFDINGNSISEISNINFASTILEVGCGRIAVANATEDTNTGALYLYDLNGTFIKKVQAPNPTSGDRFGKSVAIGIGRIVVSAPFNNSQGAAYVFDLDGNYLEKLVAPDGISGDEFGQSVAIGCGRIVIGTARWSNMTGAAYLYNTPPVYNLYDAIDLNYG